MSEYQYYEFMALDKALTRTQREELRQLSSRAKITATRFTNEYNWGGFGGDPQQMMARYFDAYLYLANFGSRHLMFRVPRAALDIEFAKQYCYTETASLIETNDHLIISLCADDEPDGYWDEAVGELGDMVAVRSELLSGDNRLLYLAWLMGIQWDQVEDEDTEPPVPAGLTDLSGALQAIVDFLEIDEDLIAVAAKASPALQRRFQGESLSPNAHGEPTRTAAQLWAEADEHKTAREETAARAYRAEQERLAAAEASAYSKRLDELALRTEAAWQEAADLIETKKPSDYDVAVSLLADLSALAQRAGDHDSFTARFLELRSTHERKPSLQDRFDKAGLPRSP